MPTLSWCMSNIAELEKKLNDAILSGKAMEAFEELYDENVVMQENSDPEFRGKELNRKREVDFFSSVEAWHDGKVTALADRYNGKRINSPNDVVVASDGAIGFTDEHDVGLGIITGEGNHIADPAGRIELLHDHERQPRRGDPEPKPGQQTG